MSKVLVTGAAGFIGSHLIAKLCESEISVIAVDSLSASYGRQLPRYRMRNLLERFPDVQFIQGDLTQSGMVEELAHQSDVDTVFHLAAWPGVRQSEERPSEYLRNNIAGLSSALEITEAIGAKRFIFASSSSVYGSLAVAGPCPEDSAEVGNQKSYYAETKMLGELLISSFTQRVQVVSVAARFFTVIGALGRPDMAYATFARNMLEGKAIPIYGNGTTTRDYTSVVDTAEALQGLMTADFATCPTQDSLIPVNIGFGTPRSVIDLAECVSNALGGIPYRIEYVEKPSADAEATHSDDAFLESLIGKRTPRTLEEMVHDALHDHKWIWSS